MRYYIGDTKRHWNGCHNRYAAHSTLLAPLRMTWSRPTKDWPRNLHKSAPTWRQTGNVLVVQGWGKKFLENVSD
jgi:hypothetical protein